jgi:hypothetical protein
MPLWTVHSKVEDPGLIRARAEDVRFVREGFNWPAFLVPPIWLVIKGMWIVLLFTLAADMLVIVLGASFKLGDGVLTILGLAINLVIGFSGNDLYRWTIARGGFREIGLAAGSDLDEAELRFFSALPQARTPVSVPTLAAPAGMTDALGLFPRPGGTR